MFNRITVNLLVRSRPLQLAWAQWLQAVRLGERCLVQCCRAREAPCGLTSGTRWSDRAVSLPVADDGSAGFCLVDEKSPYPCAYYAIPCPHGCQSRAQATQVSTRRRDSGWCCQWCRVQRRALAAGVKCASAAHPEADDQASSVRRNTKPLDEFRRHRRRRYAGCCLACAWQQSHARSRCETTSVASPRRRFSTRSWPTPWRPFSSTPRRVTAACQGT